MGNLPRPNYFSTSFQNKLNTEYFTCNKLNDMFNIYIYVFW